MLIIWSYPTQYRCLMIETYCCYQICLHSSGIAIVTLKKAALWTDGRYFEQGEMQLDCNWILQKSGKVSKFYFVLIPARSPINWKFHRYILSYKTCYDSHHLTSGTDVLMKNGFYHFCNDVSPCCFPYFKIFNDSIRRTMVVICWPAAPPSPSLRMSFRGTFSLSGKTLQTKFY